MLWQSLVAIIGGVLDRRNRIAEANAEARIANAGKIVDGAGYKDEFVLLIWSIPAILAFVPGMQAHVAQGFENLSRAPEWYLIGWVSISLAIYGLKPATKQIVKWKKGEK